MHFKWRQATAYRLLALFLALILWGYVTHQKNPVQERAARVPLQQKGLPAGMLLEDMPAEVTVFYRSSKGRLALVSANEFQARVDLAGATAGVRKYPVRVQAPPGVEVVRTVPPAVTINADRIIVKNIPVTINITGAPARGYTNLKPVVTPAVVEARGPEQALKEINRVAVSLDISGTPVGLEKVLPVSTGVEEVKLRPGNVKVTVPVKPLPSRTITVEPRVKGLPAAGLRVEKVEIKPDTVRVTAPGDVLESLNTLSTGLLEITGAVADVAAPVKVQVPAGVAVVVPGEVQMTVKIGPESPPDGEETPPENPGKDATLGE